MNYKSAIGWIGAGLLVGVLLGFIFQGLQGSVVFGILGAAAGAIYAIAAFAYTTIRRQK